MRGRVLGTWPDGSPEWHAARAGCISGSRIAGVCGWSPFGSRDDMLAEVAGLSEPRPQSRAMARGNALEAAVADWLAQDKGYTYDTDASAATWQHTSLDWAIYNPDRITTDDLLIEVKTTHNRDTESGWGRAGTDKIPLYYAAQVQWGMGVIGLDRCIVTVLHGATNGRADLNRADYSVKADPAAFRFLLAKAEQFLSDLHRRAAA